MGVDVLDEELRADAASPPSDASRSRPRRRGRSRSTRRDAAMNARMKTSLRSGSVWISVWRRACSICRRADCGARSRRTSARPSLRRFTSPVNWWAPRQHHGVLESVVRVHDLEHALEDDEHGQVGVAGLVEHLARGEPTLGSARRGARTSCSAVSAGNISWRIDSSSGGSARQSSRDRRRLVAFVAAMTIEPFTPRAKRSAWLARTPQLVAPATICAIRAWWLRLPEC